MQSLMIRVPASAVDALSDLLADDLEALAVTVEDADAGQPDEEPVFDEPGRGATGSWRRARITALFANAEDAVRAAAAVAAAQTGADAHVVAIAPVDDTDWVRLTQAQFAAMAITPQFWIVPTWCEVPAAATRAIRLDPGRAFGTGTHPTTRMCLQWIAAHGEAVEPAWQRVLDYGAGSGVLAIAAGLFGAVDVDAVDVDPAAVEASRANATANGVSLQSGTPEIASGRYGLVVANILASPLKLLAPVLSSLLDDDGTLVLSGILARQAEEIRVAYRTWLDVEVAATDDGWVLMAGRLSRRSRVA